MAIEDFYRPARRTRIDPVDLIDAFGRGYVDIRDERADAEGPMRLVKLVAAQARHELADDATTTWDDDVAYWWNLTGLKVSTDADGNPTDPFQALGTHEVVSNAEADRLIAAGLATKEKFAHRAPAGHRAVYFLPLGLKSHRATWFRAFDSLDHGAWYSLRKYLTPGQRYATPAVQAALFAGDVKAFAYALKALGYYTADKSEYARAMAAQLVKVERDAARVDWAGLPTMAARTAKRLAEQGALGLWNSVRASQQTSLADTLAEVERSRAERDEGGEG